VRGGGDDDPFLVSVDSGVICVPQRHFMSLEFVRWIFQGGCLCRRKAILSFFFFERDFPSLVYYHLLSGFVVIVVVVVVV